MAPVSVYARIRPDVERAGNRPEALKERIRAALSNQPGVSNLSFPEIVDPSPLEDERPLEDGVEVDGPPVDVRFDWDHERLTALWHSKAWVRAMGGLTRAPFLQTIPR